MDTAGPLWGSGTSVPMWPLLTCVDCHDPHGSSNYRLLKATINGNTVGGYAADGETPQAFVYSYETGYPDPTLGQTGWLKHTAGALQMADYKPDYTGGTKILHQDATGAETLSVWCAACHENYATRAGNTADNGGLPGLYSYGTSETVHAGGNQTTDGTVGAQNRHRHPVDVTLAAGWGPGRALAEEVTSSEFLPLERTLGNTATDPFYQNFLGCLTCHRAHGASASMTTTGWASAGLTYNAVGTIIPFIDGVPGVDPDKLTANSPSLNPTAPVPAGSSALLRVNDRGVCERCHNK